MWNICGEILSICSLMITNTLLGNCLKWRDSSDKPGGEEMPSPAELCGGRAGGEPQAWLSQLSVSRWNPSLPALLHPMRLFFFIHGYLIKRCKRVTSGLSSGDPRLAEYDGLRSIINITDSLMGP